MICVIDTYAWIEYINGSDEALKLRQLFLNQNNKFITMECCIAELYGFCLKKNVDFNKVWEIVKNNSVVLPVMIDVWVSAAKIRHELRKDIHDFGLVDSILVAKQKELNCKIISGDPHFKELKNILYIAAE